MSATYEPFSPAFREDPFSAYRALRAETPVHYAPGAKMFCISRYEDVSFVLRNPELFSSAAMNTVLMNANMGPIRPRYVFALLRFLWRTKINPFAIQRRGNLVSMGPPRHGALRKIVSRGFTPRRIEAWEPRAQEIVAERLRALRQRDAFDVIEEIAIPLPVTIIAEMLGVAPERQRDFKRWSDSIISVASGSAKEDPVSSGLLDDFAELYAYLRETVRGRRAAPADDLISLLVDPGQEGVLDEMDVIQFVVLLLVAGNETTTNLIGNAVNLLLDHPETLQLVASEPTLIPSLVEEVLRFEGPIQMVFRTAVRDVEIAGTRIPRGAILVPLLGSANRDERIFEDPDRFDIGRDTTGHLGFGLGAHFCLGAALARLEARVALTGLVPLLRGCKRSSDTVARVDSFLVRGPARLELRTGTRSGAPLQP